VIPIIPNPPPNSVYICPVANIAIKTPCKVSSCMYHNEASARCCSYSALNTSLHRDVTLTKEARKKVVCDFFRLEEAELAVAIRRLIAVMCVNEFFTHLFDKSILDARPKEIESLLGCGPKYEAWRPSAKKVPYTEVVTTVEFLKANMR
jgi:hypothetical protein